MAVSANPTNAEPVSYPVMLSLRGVRVLLVGGGQVASRKLAGLLASGAEVTVVAPEVTEGVARSPATVELRPYAPGEAAGYQLVMTATDDTAVNRQVADDAKAAGVFVNSADDPANCTFTLAALARRGPVTIAVSTDGHSPALAGWLRDRLAEALPEQLERIVADLAAQRRELQAEGLSTEGIDWRPRIEAALSAGGSREGLVE